MTAETRDEYTILYGGLWLTGRSTSVKTFCPMQPGEDWLEWIERIANGCDLRVGDRIVKLHVILPQFQNYFVESLRGALDHSDHAVARVAKLLVQQLPRVQGIVTCFDSRTVRLDSALWNVEFNESMLAQVGVNAKELPCVFQLTHRDGSYAVSIDHVRAEVESIAPHRKTFVESLPEYGYGVREALERVIEMIDGGTPREINGPRRRIPGSPSALFWPFESLLTLDGNLRERLVTEESKDAVRFKGEFRIALGQREPEQQTLVGAPAAYSVDIVSRHVEREDNGWTPLYKPRIIAGRLRVPGVESVRVSKLVPNTDHPWWSTPAPVLLGDLRALPSARKKRFDGKTYEAASRPGFAKQDGILLLSVGTTNEVNVWVGYDARDRVVELTVYGDEAAAMLLGDPPLAS